MERRRSKAYRRRTFWLSVGVFVLFAALYSAATGQWRDVYAFFVQFHQRVLWSGLVLVFVPVLLVLYLRSWGVEDVPYVAEIPEVGTGRLRLLSQRLRGSSRSDYAQGPLIHALSQLAAEVIALNHGLDAAAARRLCRSGEWKENELILDLVVNHRLSEPKGTRFLDQFEDVLETIETMLKGGIDIGSDARR
jgi:hypothetical protein